MSFPSGTFVVEMCDRPCVRHTHLVTGNYQTEEGHFCQVVRLRDGVQKGVRPAQLVALSEYGIALDRVVSDVVHFRRTREGTVAWEGGLSGRLHREARAMVGRLSRGEPIF